MFDCFRADPSMPGSSSGSAYSIPYCVRHKDAPERCEAAKFVLSPLVPTVWSKRGIMDAEPDDITPKKRVITPTPPAISQSQPRQTLQTATQNVSPAIQAKSRLHLARVPVDGSLGSLNEGQEDILSTLKPSQKLFMRSIAAQINAAEDRGFDVGYSEGFKSCHRDAVRDHAERSRSYRLALAELAKFQKDKVDLEEQLEASRKKCRLAEQERDETMRMRLQEQLAMRDEDELSDLDENN